MRIKLLSYSLMAIIILSGCSQSGSLNTRLSIGYSNSDQILYGNVKSIELWAFKGNIAKGGDTSNKYWELSPLSIDGRINNCHKAWFNKDGSVRRYLEYGKDSMNRVLVDFEYLDNSLIINKSNLSFRNWARKERIVQEYDNEGKLIQEWFYDRYKYFRGGLYNDNEESKVFRERLVQDDIGLIKKRNLIYENDKLTGFVDYKVGNLEGYFLKKYEFKSLQKVPVRKKLKDLLFNKKQWKELPEIKEYAFRPMGVASYFYENYHDNGLIKSQYNCLTGSLTVSDEMGYIVKYQEPSHNNIFTCKYSNPDNFNNWTKCEVYKNKELWSICERKIAYYN